MSEIQSLTNFELNKDKIFIIPKSLISKKEIKKPQKKLFSRIKLFLILSFVILIPILIIIFLRKKIITRKNPEIITTYKEEEKNPDSEAFYNNILKLINTEINIKEQKNVIIIIKKMKINVFINIYVLKKL